MDPLITGLARWLRARGIEAYVMHPTSVVVSGEHRRTKAECLDVWSPRAAGEPERCRLVAAPTVEQNDAKRPNREREALLREGTRIVTARLAIALSAMGKAQQPAKATYLSPTVRIH